MFIQSDRQKTKGLESMKTTIRRISEATGFSAATISNALNRKKGVNPRTAEEIFKTASEMGYLQAAQQRKIHFVMYRTNGRITDDTPFFTMMMDGFQSECRRRGYDMGINYLDRRAADFKSQLDVLLEDRDSLVALMGAELMDQDLHYFSRARCRIVTLDYWSEDLPYSGIITNNSESARTAVNYLVEKGHRRLGYLRGDFRIKAFKLREAGYRAALAEQGIPYDPGYTVTVSTTMDGAYRDMLAYLKKKPGLAGAYFADNDMIALGCMKALQECGIQIPGDVSLIGFDDLPFCDIVSPGLTSLRVPKQELGQMAVRRLLDIVEEGMDTKTQTLVSTRFVERDSVSDANGSDTIQYGAAMGSS